MAPGWIRCLPVSALSIAASTFSGFPGGGTAVGLCAGQTRLNATGRSARSGLSPQFLSQRSHICLIGGFRPTPRGCSRRGCHWKGEATLLPHVKLVNRIVMQLTKRFVKAKNPCTSGYRWFLRDQNGQGDYQEILDALVADNRIDDACWLLDQFGPTDAVLTVDFIDANAIIFAGTLVVRQGINVDTVARAGRWIRTEGGIKAGTDIVAGEGIEAQGGIVSGGHIRAEGDVSAGWGIEAKSRFECGGNVRAKWDIIAGQGISITGDIRAGQGLIAGGSIKCEQGIRAGGKVEAEHDIVVARGIQAGESIVAGNH